MKHSVRIINPAWSTLGGGERYLCVVAETLLTSGAYEVTLVVEDPTITISSLGRYFGVNLDSAAVERTYTPLSRGQRPDIEIIYSNFRPFPLNGRRNIVVLQTPYGEISVRSVLREIAHGGIRAGMKDILRKRLYTLARQADRVLVNSQFACDALTRHHGLPATVLYPPIDDYALPGILSEPIILSVGRFFRGLYNDKRHDVMIDAFKRLVDASPNTRWSYHLAGSCSPDPVSTRYLEQLRAEARGYPIFFHPNVPFEDLRRLYNRATLFWHAAGYGIDERVHPECVEHFGMTTVEAMSAGCVPVVINKGGQKEIVLHGRSGFLWSTVRELVEISGALIGAPEQIMALREECRQRFRIFARPQFERAFLSFLAEVPVDR